MAKISIIGAGLAGLLAGNLLMRHRPKIFEAQPTLPNNHSAVLRFRSPIISDVTGIPFRRVTMVRDNLPWRNPVADTLAYSHKNTGQFRSDRSITDGLVVGDRWIAPKDFISQLANDQDITFNHTFSWCAGEVANKAGILEPSISTIPMPMLMRLLNYPQAVNINFNSRPGMNVIARIKDCDAYVSLMVPDPRSRFSRISVTGDEMIVELPGVTDLSEEEMVDVVNNAIEVMGIPETSLRSFWKKPQKYAKIDPVPERVRKDFMFWATDKYNVYSLGRFATWRPGLLLDDLVQDIRLIEKWIVTKSPYDINKHRRP